MGSTVTWVPQRSHSEEESQNSQESRSEDDCRRNSQHPHTQLIWKCGAIQVWPESQEVCSKDHDRINYKLILPEVSNPNGSVGGFSSHHFLPALWLPSPPKMALLECGLFSSHQGGFPSGTSSEESACQCRRRGRRGFNPWVRKIPWGRAWHPTPMFVSGKPHGQRSLVGYRPEGHKELDSTEATLRAP